MDIFAKTFSLSLEGLFDRIAVVCAEVVELADTLP